MTKSEFLNELSSGLAGLDGTLRGEIYNDFADHFTEGAAQGMSEDEICRSLGQPAAIIKQCLEEYGSEVGVELQSPPKENTLQTGAQQPVPPQAQPPQTAFPFDGEFYDIDISKSFQGINHIRAELKSGDLRFSPEPQSEAVTVKLNGRARHDRFTVEAHGDELVITENTPPFSFRHFFTRKALYYAVIGVPASFNGNIKAHVAGGETNVSDISGNELRLTNRTKNTRVSGCAFAYLDIHASAGNVTIERCAGNMETHCTAGNMTITGHKAERIALKATAGQVKLMDCDADIDARASAGNMEIICESNIPRAINVTSSAGDIRIKAAETREMKLNCSAGNIKAFAEKISGETRLSSSAGNILLESREVAGNIEARSSAGNIHIKLPYDADCRIEAETRMGNLNRKINGREQSPYTLRASASMGNVTLEGV